MATTRRTVHARPRRLCPRCVPHREGRPHADGVRHQRARQSHPSARAGAARRRRGGADHLHAGAVRVAVLLPVRESRLLRAGRTDPRAVDRRLPAVCEEARRGGRGVALRKARRGAVPQHRGGHRRRRLAARHLPQDAHPRRPALLREVLLHARRYRLPRLEDEVRHHRRAHLLGSVVSRSRPAHGARRRGDHLLPHGHRLASEGEEALRRGAASVVGSDPAQSRRGQWLLRGRRQSHRPRARGRAQRQARGRRWPRVLGPVVSWPRPTARW